MKSGKVPLVAGSLTMVVMTVALSVLNPNPSFASEPGAAPATEVSAAEDMFDEWCTWDHVRCQNGTEYWTYNGEDPQSANWCWSADRAVRVCVKYYGDYVFVKDTAADGASAIGQLHRTDHEGYVRVCRNPWGKGTWAKCNFDWAENNWWYFKFYTFDKDKDPSVSWEYISKSDFFVD